MRNRDGIVSGAPRFPEGPEVEGSGQNRPLSRYVVQTAQQESPRPLLLLDDPEDQLHPLLSQFVRFFGCIVGHPSVVTARGCIVPSYSYGAAVFVLGAYSKAGQERRPRPATPWPP